VVVMLHRSYSVKFELPLWLIAARPPADIQTVTEVGADPYPAPACCSRSRIGWTMRAIAWRSSILIKGVPGFSYFSVSLIILCEVPSQMHLEDELVVTLPDEAIILVRILSAAHRASWYAFWLEWLRLPPPKLLGFHPRST